MKELIDRNALDQDFQKCNVENPNWTPQRVRNLIFRQPSEALINVQIDLEAFHPEPGQYVMWTIDTDVFDIASVSEVFERLVQAFPNNKIIGILNYPLKAMSKEDAIKMLKRQLQELEEFE